MLGIQIHPIKYSSLDDDKLILGHIMALCPSLGAGQKKKPAELQRQLHSEHLTDMGGYSCEPMDPLDSPYCREQGNICASSTTHTELPETQQEVRETQHYGVVPEAEATREGTHRKCLFYKFWDFRHWNFHILDIGICCSGK